MAADNQPTIAFYNFLRGEREDDFSKTVAKIATLCRPLIVQQTQTHIN